MPVVTMEISKGATVPYALHKAARLVTHGIVLLIGERSQRVVTDIHTIGVNLKLGARCAILEIILAVMLGHEGALHEGF